MHLTQKYTEGLFLEVLCLSIPQRLGAPRVELAGVVTIEENGDNNLGIMPCFYLQLALIPWESQLGSPCPISFY